MNLKLHVELTRMSLVETADTQWMKEFELVILKHLLFYLYVTLLPFCALNSTDHEWNCVIYYELKILKGVCGGEKSVVF